MNFFLRIRLFLFLGLILLSISSGAQNWTWQSGHNTTNHSPIYGTLGTSSPNNYPGTRSDMVSWVDNNGFIWLFGGSFTTNTNIQYTNTNPSLYVYNDIWKFDPVTNVWTWMNGDNNLNKIGIYSPAGEETFSGYYKPGGRKGVNSWRDQNGDVWLFGGYGIAGYTVATKGLLSDLWKYNVSHNSWTFIKGNIGINETGNYGTSGVPAASNLPGGRSESTTWVDEKGTFWMYGGRSWNSTYNEDGNALGDLWKYERGTNYWTYMRGFSSSVNTNGIYSLNGSGQSLKPGCRHGGASWSDDRGNLYLFGGSGPASSSDIIGEGVLNDLWKFNTTSNQWAFINGDSIANVKGAYGTKNIYSSSNKPGGRVGAVTWKDADGIF